MMVASGRVAVVIDGLSRIVPAAAAMLKARLTVVGPRTEQK